MRQTLIPCVATPARLACPLVASKVAAGFPSPAEDYIERRLDLSQLLIRHADSTFFMKVRGDSMVEARIFDGDLLVVDRSMTPEHGAVVIAVLNGEITVKRLHRRGRVIRLCPANKDYKDIEVSSDAELIIWGVVTSVIRKI